MSEARHSGTEGSAAAAGTAETPTRQVNAPKAEPSAAPAPPAKPPKNAVLKDGDYVFDASSPHSPNTRHKDFPLYDYEHIPQWLEGNPYIQSYYRCGYTTARCFKSVFALHNETFNIWTHTVGFMVALSLAAHIMLHMKLGRKRDYLVFSLLELGSLCMMGGSSVYHTLSAHYSARVHDCALSFDYFGISLMIIGSFYPPVFYLFSCSKETRFSYFAVVTTLGLISLLGPLIWPHFNTDRFYHVRLLLFCSMAVVGGLMPGFHMFVSLPANEYTTPVYQGLLLCVTIYSVGMVLYLFKIPECFFPGKFDLTLSSHQLWHFFVLCAAVVQYFTSISAFELWRVTGSAGGECV